jgi:uncharacterized protein (TIGR04255 family)
MAAAMRRMVREATEVTTSYPHPPIVEAIIEFRFGGSGTDKALQTAVRRFGRAYPRAEIVRQLAIGFGDAASFAPPIQSPEIHKFSSIDGVDIALLQKDRVAVSRLTPYLGWDSFIAGFRDALDLAAAVTKKRKLTRIGVRFINRIDVPAEQDGGFDHTRYITLGVVALPFDHGAIGVLAFSVSSVLEQGKFGFVLNVYKSLSPVSGRAGLVFDIEVFNQANLPNDPEDIWTQVAEMRMWKNTIFENAITDSARELFR